MYYIRPLHHLELALQKRSLFIKILLVVLPLSIAGAVVFLNSETVSNKNKIQSDIKNIQTSLKQQVVMLDIIKEIDDFSSMHDITIDTHKIESEQLYLTMTLPQEVLTKLIEFLELFHPFSKIDVLEVTQNNTLLQAQIKLSFLNYFSKPKYSKPVEQNSETSQVYTLQAIVGNHVLINNQWYDNHSFFNEFKIRIVNANRIELVSNEMTLKLKVYNATK